MKVTNTETFVKKASHLHNNFYDYSKVTFVSSKTKITIICPTHGEFEQTPNNHLSNFGCIACGTTKSKTKQTSSFDEFVKKATSVHGDKYTYNESTYVNSKTNTTITCKIHGDFEQRPGNHYHKTFPQGCPECGRLTTKTKRVHPQDKIISLFVKTHGDIYDYSKVKYTNYRSHVAIVCKTHGVFSQQPSHHINGTGCPSCASTGFNKNKPAVLYYLSINKGQAYKIGITNRDVDERFTLSELQSIDVIFKTPCSGIEAVTTEKQILKTFVKYKYSGPNLLLSGNTELFNVDIFNTLPNNASISTISDTLANFQDH